MEITDNLPQYINYLNERGQVMEQSIEYEWLPTKCSNCKKLGHTVASCKYVSEVAWRKKESKSNLDTDPTKVVDADSLKPSSTVPIQLTQHGVTQSSAGPNELSWSILRRTVVVKPVEPIPVEQSRNSYSVLQEQQKTLSDPFLIVGLNGVLQHTDESDQFLHCRVRICSRNQDFCLTIVHVSNSLEARRNLWYDLANLHFPIKPWIILGDFNAVFDIADRIGGRSISVKEMEDSRQWLALGLVDEMKIMRPTYTRSNNQEGGTRIFYKLDRVFTNKAWMDSFPLASTFSQWEVILDNSFILIKKIEVWRMGVKPFHFYNMWSSHDKLRETVLASWSKPLLFEGRGLGNIVWKLTHLKHVLKNFNLRAMGDVFL
ncbi:uncharacterized protein LOC133779767 [Humulus lupulus]|uniref:uncharacterized protein LOC133779767 n=1 Tax=Humulus lupulus TaxID=3486 RepID=UPI002B418046|nr:uncharacterized protein LOC133779767 [Humulus lupulus]